MAKCRPTLPMGCKLAISWSCAGRPAATSPGRGRAGGGYCTWQVAAGGPLLLVAGGSGIVPLMAMIRHRAAHASTVPTRLLYSSRAFDEIIYRQELAQLASADPTLTVAHTLTRHQPPD